MARHAVDRGKGVVRQREDKRSVRKLPRRSGGGQGSMRHRVQGEQRDVFP